jgi:16S rRNA processing protein RimM
VVARGDDVPPLPDGVYWVDRLVGARVEQAEGPAIGRVEDVMETGGCDVLVVRGTEGEEILVPLAREIVTSVDTQTGTIRVELPEGLRELNAPGAGGDGTRGA